MVVPGSADFINFLGPETVSTRYRRRNIYSHNPQAILIPTNLRDNIILGGIIDRLNLSRGPVVVLWPRKELSTLDRRGKPFWNPEADMALLKTLRKKLADRIPLMEPDQYVNDPHFAQAVFRAFEMIQKNK